MRTGFFVFVQVYHSGKHSWPLCFYAFYSFLTILLLCASIGYKECEGMSRCVAYWNRDAILRDTRSVYVWGYQLIWLKCDCLTHSHLMVKGRDGEEWREGKWVLPGETRNNNEWHKFIWLDMTAAQDWITDTLTNPYFVNWMYTLCMSLEVIHQTKIQVSLSIILLGSANFLCFCFSCLFFLSFIVVSDMSYTHPPFSCLVLLILPL